MAKRNNILRGSNETKELQRIINNYNAKISRLQKKNPEMAEYLPEKVTKREVLESVENKTELNKVKNSLKRFSKRGSENLVQLPQGDYTTQYAVDELKRSAKAFNSKVIRTWRKDAENRDKVPDRVSVKDLLESAESKSDIERINSSLQRFQRRGAEDFVKSNRGAKATKWEVDEFYRKQQIENERRRKQREKINSQEVKIGGEGTGQTRSQMGSIKENSLRESHKKFDNLSQKEWELASRNIDNLLDARHRAERNEIMRENYLRGLRENGFLDASPEIEEWIRNIDFNTFLSTVETDETATFYFYNDPQAFDVRLTEIRSAWHTAFTNYEEGGN